MHCKTKTISPPVFPVGLIQVRGDSKTLKYLHASNIILKQVNIIPNATK